MQVPCADWHNKQFAVSVHATHVFDERAYLSLHTEQVIAALQVLQLAIAVSALQVEPDKYYPVIQAVHVVADVEHAAQGEVHAVHEVAVATQNPGLHAVQVMV